MLRSIYKKIVWPSLVSLLLFGCSNKTPVQTIYFPEASPEPLLTGAIVQLGPNNESYIQYLVDRLQGFGAVASPAIQIVFVKRDDVAVVSSAGGLTTISTGTLALIDNEAEFAFILAHELAHHMLNHTSSTKTEADLEYEADQLGGRLFFRAGYAPQASFQALIDCYQGIHYFEKNRDTWAHPQAHQRIIALTYLYREMGARGAGSVNSADFIEFRSSLLS